MSDPVFEYEKFHDLLLDALRQGFVRMQHNHPTETFYMFGLWIWAEATTVCITADTEEGLLRRTEAYSELIKKTQWGHDYEGITFDELKESMWFDLPSYFCEEEYKDLLIDINNMLGISMVSLFQAEMALGEEVDDYEAWKIVHEPHWEKLNDVCLRVLKQLDTEGLFSKRQPRQNIMLCYLIGDFDPLTFLQFAAELNPPEIVERLRIANAVFEDVLKREQENQARRIKKAKSLSSLRRLAQNMLRHRFHRLNGENPQILRSLSEKNKRIKTDKKR